MANQAWQITAPGKLSLVDLGPTLPKPGPKQVLVRVHAVSLNYRDVLVVRHDPSYPVTARPDLVPCSDGAGIVGEVGAGSKWKKGDRVNFHPNTWISGSDPRNFVISRTMGGGDVDGTLRRWIVSDDERIFAAPDGISMEQAATLYTAGCTAWHALFHGLFKLEPGMTALTQGTGGVSSYAIMIAAALGATVVATSSSDEKLEFAKQLGATHLINYRKCPDWAAEVLKATNGTGVDIVVDVVGASSIQQTIKATRQGGLISLVGMLSTDPNQQVDIMLPLLFGAKTIQGCLGAGSRQMSEELSDFMQKHKLQPPIAHTFEFEEAKEALEAITKLTAPGKVVIKV